MMFWTELQRMKKQPLLVNMIEQNRALHDGLIYISASPLVAVLFFVYDYSINISAKEKAL